MGLRLTVALGLGAALGGAVVFIACGIDEGGVVAPPTPQGEGGPDVNIDTSLPPACGDAAACLPTVPSGWQITGLLSSPMASCPANFNQADQIKDLSATGCQCACTDQGDASCGGSIVTYTNQGALTCTDKDAGVLPGDGGCVANNGGGLNNASVGASTPPLQGIKCASIRTADAGFDSVPVRLCEPTCQADFCGQLQAASATPCIVSPGDVQCPAGFSQRTLIATSASVACASCPQCAGPSATCTGTVSFYGDNQCSNLGYSVVADGKCHGQSGNDAWQSLSETTTLPSSPHCAAQANDPGGDAGPIGAKTLCCR
jgi:hypothetical protein